MVSRKQTRQGKAKKDKKKTKKQEDKRGLRCLGNVGISPNEKMSSSHNFLGHKKKYQLKQKTKKRGGGEVMVSKMLMHVCRGPFLPGGKARIAGLSPLVTCPYQSL